MISSHPIPSPAAIKSQIPLSKHGLGLIADTKLQIRKILSGEDPRWLVIVGPCSIHDSTAGLEYATKLRDIAQKTSGTMLIVMRTYYEKSRTSSGWKGFLYDPHLNGTQDILEGIQRTRRFLVDVADIGVPTAAEILDPLSTPYFSDLLSWACIGARTATSQIHRQLASGLNIPVGIKNSTDGNIDNAVYGATVAASPHNFISVNEDGHLAMVSAKGNPDVHIVLRGSDSRANYDTVSLTLATKKLSQAGLSERLIVDCSHGNSQRQPFRQPDVLRALLKSRDEGHCNVCGIIIESNLEYGQQPLHPEAPLKYGISITDPCLGWSHTEELLLEAHERLLNGACIKFGVR